MHWDHRVMRPTDGPLGVYEVCYDGEDDLVVGWSAEPVAAVGDDLDELVTVLSWMVAALGRPVLDEAELEARPNPSRPA